MSNVLATYIQEALLAAFEEKNIENFRRALKLTRDAEKIDKLSSTSLFEIICSTPGSAVFIQACLELDANCNPLKQNKFYRKSPAHFALESGDPENLRVVLNGIEKWNILSDSHESYDEDPPLFHTVINKITSENLESSIELLKVLIEFSTDINCSSHHHNGHTAFTLLLEKLSAISDYETASAFLDYVVRKYLFIDIHTVHEQETKDRLQHYPKLLKLLTPDQYEGLSAADVSFKLACHMYTNEKKFIQEIQTLHKNPDFYYIMNDIVCHSDLLLKTVKEGLVFGVEVLINLGADASKEYNNGESAISMACSYGYWKILKKFLEKNSLDNFSLLHKTIENYKKKNDSDYMKCFELLIENENFDVNQQDEKGRTALFYACQINNNLMIRKLLDKNAFIGSTAPSRPVEMSGIPVEVLEDYLDSCIKTNGLDRANDQFEIIFDYSCLVPPAEMIYELTPIEYLLENENYKHLIVHPLLTSFLFLKLFKANILFFFNILLLGIYLVAFGAFIWECHANVFLKNCADFVRPFLLLSSFIIILAQEIFEMFMEKLKYFKSLKNLFEWTLLLLTFMLFIYDENLASSSTDFYWYGDTIFGLLVLFTIIKLLLIFAAIPHSYMTKYLIMLKKVYTTYFKVMLVYLWIVLGFAFCFYKMIGKQFTDECYRTGSDDCYDLNKFGYTPIAIVKTFIMFAGEFDASDIDFQDNKIAYAVFILFVVFITVGMTNLLNALAVSDVQELKYKAHASIWTYHAQTLIQYERWVSKVLKSFNSIIIKNNSKRIWFRKHRNIEQPENESTDQYIWYFRYAMDKDILVNAYDVLDCNAEKDGQA